MRLNVFVLCTPWEDHKVGSFIALHFNRSALMFGKEGSPEFYAVELLTSRQRDSPFELRICHPFADKGPDMGRYPSPVEVRK